MVRPPYGTKLYQYPDQVRLIITSPVDTRVTLVLHITGDNGVDLRTAPGYASPFISISANVANQVSGSDLSGYFDYTNLISSGISIQQLNDNGLPEGNYQICFRLKNLDGSFISAEEPIGCSNQFSIRYGDPPVAINPQCGAILNQSAIQSIVFSWTPATNAPVFTQYTLKIVELLDSTQSPDAAMLSATEPPFFETTVQGAFSFFYGPSQPILEKGNIYAWQVIAEEEETGAKFANDGRSQVCWFKWNPPGLPVFTVTQQPDIKPSGEPRITKITNVDPVPISVVSGNLNYKFKGSSPAGSLSQSSQQGANSQLVLTTTGDGLSYNQNNVSTADSKPLANVKISLVVTYVLKGKINNKDYNGQVINMDDIREDSKFLEQYPDHEKVLATTTTSSDGSFSFQFMNTEQKLGLVNDNTNWQSGGGEFYDKVTGKVYKVIRLRVENKYYLSPDVNIKLEPWQALDLGTLVSYVKSYNLKVHTQWTKATFFETKGGQGISLDKIKTILLRKYFVSGVPSDEAGYSTSGNRPVLTVLPKELKTDYSKEDGTLTFTNLVQHDPDNTQDRYYLLCEPDKNNGIYIFKKKEKAYYPIYFKDKKEFPFNCQRFESSGSNMPLSQSSAYGENITWNSELQVKTYELNMELYPDKPRIFGKVEATDVNAKPISNVNLLLLNNYTRSSNYNVLLRTAKTDAKGFYEFNNLDLELDSFNLEGPTKVLGPDRTLICSAPGFKGMSQKFGVMVWGQQEEKNFKMEPDGLLSGYIVDDKGNAVAADIQVDDLAFASTTVQLEYNTEGNGRGGGGGGNVSAVNTLQAGNNNAVQIGAVNTTQINMPSGVKQVFSISAPSGKGRKLKIIPRDPGYTSETYTVDIPKEINANANEPLKPYLVFRLKKRVRFLVAEKPGGLMYVIANLKPVPGAEVTLKIPGMDVKENTDPRGNVTFEFENNGTSFTFDIKPPENSDLEDGTYTINNVKDGKFTVIYPAALLKKATKIKGKVTLGNDQTALENATVYIENGNGGRIETKTDNAGNYTLGKVPREPGSITVWASKPNILPNIISQSKQLELKDVNELNFTLQTDNEIAIENIYGFQVDIKDKEKQSDDTYLLRGALINLPSNPNFKPAEGDQTIPFTNLKIKKSGAISSTGIPIGVPSAADFESDIKDMSLLMNDAFGVLLTPSTGALLKVSSDNNKGQIKGKAGIMKTSFQYSGSYITFQDNIPLFLTVQPGNSESAVVTLTTADYPAKKWGIANDAGNDVQFKFLDFNAKADKATSWLEGNKIALSTVLTTNEIPGMVPAKLSVAIGELILKPSAIEPITGNKPLSFKLEKWDFQSTGWTIQQTKKGVYIPQGTIKTGLIDVPVKNLLITPDNFQVGDFEIQNLTFSGVTPLNILTTNRSFGYNTSTGSDLKGHWELRIIGLQGTPGVSVSGLPGMEPGAAMKFQSFSLLSNGEQDIDMGNQQQEIVFYKILKVQPLSFSGGDKYFQMSCNIDLNIPRLKPASGVIKFSKPASQVNFELYPFNVSFDGPGGVKFISGITQGDQKLEASGFTATGTIKDYEGINLKGKLHRTQNSAWIEVDPQGTKDATGDRSDIPGEY